MFVIGVKNTLVYLISNAEKLPYEIPANVTFYNPPIRNFYVYVKELLESPNEDPKTCIFYYKEPYVVWHSVFGKTVMIDAAGIVPFYHDKESYSLYTLMIYRREKWDFPKGKIESGEKPVKCALREFKEECGIPPSVKLPEPQYLTRSYYIFYKDGRQFSKEVKWYGLMLNEKLSKFSPQKSEDITDVKWIGKDSYHLILPHTYPIIKDILFRFLIREDKWGKDFYYPEEETYY